MNAIIFYSLLASFAGAGSLGYASHARGRHRARGEAAGYALGVACTLVALILVLVGGLQQVQA